MRLIPRFEKFLVDEVNLNKSRIKTLTDRVGIIETFVRSSDWRPRVLRFSAQGSWAHKTIIKPPGSGGFDADLLAFVSPVAGWTAKDYVLDLRRVFNASGTYKERNTLGNRCVTLEYASDFSLDVVPCVVDRPPIPARFEVCNRIDDVFEPTNSELFTTWLDQRNAWVGNENLRKVLRLFKYLRDVKTTFSCKSVLLNTLIAGGVDAADALNQSVNFPDLPTALKTLIGRLDNYLQARPKLHKVQNPVLPAEDFMRHWDDDKYENFREIVHKYRGWIDEAYAAPDEAGSIAKWRRVFGDEFARGSDVEQAFVTEAALPVIYSPTRFHDAVEAVKSAGRAILANVPMTLPWVQPAPFRVLPARFTVIIGATTYALKDGPPLRQIDSGSFVTKHCWILYEALNSNGTLFIGKDFTVQWRVVNSDRDAINARALRGGFYPSNSPSRRWETTLYRGIHWVEAFVIRKRDGVCVGQSSRFFIVIE